MPDAFRETYLQTPPEERGSLTLLDRLRSETKEEHQRLEEELDLLRPDLSLDAYVRLLSRFYGFYRPWEEKVASVGAQLLPDFAARQVKVSMLIADLSYFGLAYKALPLCHDLPKWDRAAGALGALYVTEGATLGGQLISRHVRRTFGLPEGKGYTFFCSYADRVGPMWTVFRDALLRYSSPAADDDIVEGASQTFRRIREWLIEEGDGDYSATA